MVNALQIRRAMIAAVAVAASAAAQDPARPAPEAKSPEVTVPSRPRVSGETRGNLFAGPKPVVRAPVKAAPVVAPRYFSQVGKSEIAVARAQIDALEKAVQQYRLDTGKFPTSEQGLTALVKKPPEEPKWNGPYLGKGIPLDPWGQPYQYKHPSPHGDYEIVSYGKDRQAGGTNENADITSY